MVPSWFVASTRCRSRPTARSTARRCLRPAEGIDAEARAVRCPAHGRRGGARRDRGRAAGSRPRRGPRQLLRDGRRLDRRHPARLAGPAGGPALDPAQLFRTPTIAGLASAVVAARRRRRSAAHGDRAVRDDARMARPRRAGSPVRGERAGSRTSIPSRRCRKGMLFHTLVDPEAGHYVEQFVCGLRGALDLPALREAWQRLVARHAALRSTIHWSDRGLPYQVVHRRADDPGRVPRLAGLADAERTRRLAALPRLGPPDGLRPDTSAAVAPGTDPGRRATCIGSSGASTTSRSTAGACRSCSTRSSTPMRRSVAARSPTGRRPGRSAITSPGSAPRRAGRPRPTGGGPCGASRGDAARPRWARARDPRRRAPGGSAPSASGARRRRTSRSASWPVAAADAQHAGPGRLGHLAGPLQRPVRRGLRRHRLGPAARAGRRRVDGRHVHQHAAGPRRDRRASQLVAWLRRLQDALVELRRLRGHPAGAGPGLERGAAAAGRCSRAS